MNKTLLIAEFGMCHDGKMETVKDLIRTAKRCGADLAKGQAFLARDVKGSMPAKFYDDRQLSAMQLIELIEYGREIGIEVFFSIFSKEYSCIRAQQKFQKFSAGQSRSKPRDVEASDSPSTIVSVGSMSLLPRLKLAKIMYACSYMTELPGLECIDFLTEFYGRQVGYSDHTIGIDWCVRANKLHGANVIEKHFTLTRDIYFEGKQFRDAVHGATPSEFEQLARSIS